MTARDDLWLVPTFSLVVVPPGQRLRPRGAVSAGRSRLRAALVSANITRRLAVVITRDMVVYNRSVMRVKLTGS